MQKLSYKVGLYLITGLIIIFSAQIITRVYWQLPQLSELEKIANQKELQRFTHSIEIFELDMLAYACETSTWDALYEYIETRQNLGIISAVLNTDSLNQYRISGVQILDTDNQSRWSFDGDNNPGDISTIIEDIHQQILSAANASNELATMQGSLRFEDKLIIFGGCELRPEDEDVEPRGSVIYWHYVDKQSANDVRKYAQLDYTLYPYEKELPDGSQSQVETLTWTVVDYQQKPIFNAVITLPGPHIHIELLDEQTIIGIGISIGVFIMLIAVLNYQIIGPIQGLKQHIETIQKNGDYSLRADGSSPDEVGSLARGLNRFIEHIETQESALKAANRKFKALSDLDPLTGIANRRAVENFMQQCFEDNSGDDLSVIMIDADNFKLYNDNYGHQKGDDVLRAIASSIQQNIHASTDMAARYGGEEFIVILTGTNKQNTEHVANNLVNAIQSLGIEHKHNPGDVLTISAGYTVAKLQAGQSPEKLIEAADKALYQAKEQGRNQACYGETPST